MDSLTLSLVGAAYGGGVALRLGGWPGRRTAIEDRALASLFVCLALGCLSIALQHSGAAGSWIGLLERVEYAAGLAAGPLLLRYVRAVRGRARRPRDRWHLVSALAAAILPGSGGNPLLGLPIEGLMLHQMAYTTAAAFVWVSGRVPEQSRHRSWGRYVLIAMAGIHGAQVARLLGSDVELLRDAVPVSLSLAALGLGVVAIRAERRRRGETARVSGKEQVGGPTADEDRERLRRLERLVEEEHAYRDPGLGLASLAGKVGIGPHELSRLLNQVLGRSFHDFVNEHRVRDAKRRLLDPAHDCYSIDGIASMCGFGSRSAFYTAFGRFEEVSPSDLRDRKRFPPPARSPSGSRRPDPSA